MGSHRVDFGCVGVKLHFCERMGQKKSGHSILGLEWGVRMKGMY